LAFRHRGCRARGFFGSWLITLAHAQPAALCAICHNCIACAGVTDFRDESRSSKNTLTRLRKSRIGRRDTMSLRPSPCRSFARTRPSPHATSRKCVGADSILVRGPIGRGTNDQRSIRDGSCAPGLPRSLEVSKMPNPCRWIYEWKRAEKTKQPYCFEVHGGQLFALAGLWEGWKDPSGTCIQTCTILTTTPNAVTLAVHDRMPVILAPGDYNLWLDPGMKDTNVVSEFLKPFDAIAMRSYPVSSRVSHVQNDDEGCASPVDVVEAQPGLF
jgi:hypothetical protein